jgi:hypothetical protein
LQIKTIETNADTIGANKSNEDDGQGQEGWKACWNGVTAYALIEG